MNEYLHGWIHLAICLPFASLSRNIFSMHLHVVGCRKVIPRKWRSSAERCHGEIPMVTWRWENPPWLSNISWCVTCWNLGMLRVEVYFDIFWHRFLYISHMIWLLCFESSHVERVGSQLFINIRLYIPLLSWAAEEPIYHWPLVRSFWVEFWSTPFTEMQMK